MRNGKCRVKQENFKYRTNFFIKMQTFGQKNIFEFETDYYHYD